MKTYKIKLVDPDTTNELLAYDSSIIPMKDDIYSANNFEDDLQRTVICRQMMIADYMQDIVLVHVKISFPYLKK